MLRTDLYIIRSLKTLYTAVGDLVEITNKIEPCNRIYYSTPTPTQT